MLTSFSPQFSFARIFRSNFLSFGILFTLLCSVFLIDFGRLVNEEPLSLMYLMVMAVIVFLKLTVYVLGQSQNCPLAILFPNVSSSNKYHLKQYRSRPDYQFDVLLDVLLRISYFMKVYKSILSNKKKQNPNILQSNCNFFI